jgi:Phage integrase SAM-like domain
VLVAEREILVVHTDDPSQKDVAYQHAIKDGRTASGKKGACVRWAVHSKDDCTFRLDLQGLPMTAAMASSKPSLEAEEAPTVMLASNAIHTDLFGSSTDAVGPVVLFFSSDVARASVALRSQPNLLRNEISRFTWKLIAREYLDLRSAADLAQHPREGMVQHPFHQAEEQQGPSGLKRPQEDVSKLPAGHSGKNSKLKTFRKYPSSLPTRIEPCVLQHIIELLPTELKNGPFATHLIKRLSQSLTDNSWKRFETALNSFQNFSQKHSKQFIWPITSDWLISYVIWADMERNLAASTIKTYIQTLKKIQEWSGFSTKGIFDNGWLESYFKGMKNAKLYEASSQVSRRPVTLEILQILGHQIDKTDWSEISKLTVWGAATLAFWGSFRL